MGLLYCCSGHTGQDSVPGVSLRPAAIDGDTPSPGPADCCPFPAAGLDFEAILMQPSNPPDKTQVPMVVMPHGRHLAKEPCPGALPWASSPSTPCLQGGHTHPLSLPGCCSQRCSARWALQCYSVSRQGRAAGFGLGWSNGEALLSGPFCTLNQVASARHFQAHPGSLVW